MPESRRSTIAILIVTHLIAGALFLAPGYIRPDSVAVYAYLRSSVIDGDFSFFNEWAMTGLVRNGVTLFSEITKTGALANHWWIGTSLLDAPFYLLARGTAAVAPALASPDGFSGLYGVVLAWASVAFSVVALAIAAALTRDFADRTTRAIAIGAAALGTPYFWYVFRFPLGTHAAGAFCVALILAALFRCRTSDAIAGAAVGLATGFAIATRLQHFVLIPAVVHASVRARRSRAYWLAAIGAGAVPLLCQAIAWQAIYGSPFGPLTSGANFEGTTWMPFQHVTFLAVLFTSYHGLFSWSPVVILAIAGWIVAAMRSDGERRALSLTLMLMFAGEWFANGAFDRYFWGGLSFGGRRFVDLLVPFAIGLAWLAVAAGRRVTAIVCALCVAWSAALMCAAAAGQLSLSRYVSGGDLFRAALSGWQNAAALASHSPIHDGRLALQSLVSIAIIAAVAAVIALVARRRQTAVAATALYCAFIVAGTLAAAMTTRSHAAADATRLGIDAVASARVGPLLDQRGLLLDEIAYSRATGDPDRAAATEAEVAAIDRLITSLANRRRNDVRPQ